MDAKEAKLVIDDARVCLTQIAAELDAAAEGARQAAAALPVRGEAWQPVQQMYTRLAEAEHLIAQFKSRIDSAVAQGLHERE